MAQSTTVINASALAITVAAQDIAGSVAQVSLNVNRDIGAFKTADGDWTGKLAGKQDWSGVITLVYSETSDEAWEEIVTLFDNGNDGAILVSPAGNTTGDVTFSGNVKFSEMPYVFNAQSADAIVVAVPFEGNGALTRGTAA